MAATAKGCVWFQRIVGLKKQKRGCHLITDELVKAVPELKNVSIGVMHLCIQHTSASICLNENADPSVRTDTEMALNHIVPEKGLPYEHTMEGPDDMPAHLKTALIGSTLTVPITNGTLNLGTWQGLWLCEHRNRADSRKIVVTIQGAPKE
uniref:Uncharacterized protein n=1 Tax=Plectus sambesii TaxID=2011161 RepID=A0A914UMR8_9BILA